MRRYLHGGGQVDLRTALGFGRMCVRQGVMPAAIVRAHTVVLERAGQADSGGQAQQLSRSFELLTAVMLAFGLAFKEDVDAAAERHRIAHELAGAAEIQRVLVPTRLPAREGLDIALRSEPARVVGGDYVDLLERPDGSLTFAIGDVSGKSIAAAIIVSMIKHLTHGLVAVLGTEDLALIARLANAIVYKDIESEVFVTLCLGSIDPQTRMVRLCNAGHVPPLLYRASSRTIEEPGETGIVLGAVESFPYIEERMQLARGDVVLLVTDGLTEAFNDGKEQFGTERIKEILSREHARGAGEIADIIYSSVLAFAHGELDDDASLLALKL